MENWQIRTKGWQHDADNIKGFFGEYRWLSNYHLCPVVYKGLPFKPPEEAYQAAKCDDVEDMQQFVGLAPNKAKQLGQKVKLRDDWEQVKLEEMEYICWCKFRYNEDLRQKLLLTGSKYLEETNWWNDKFWGVCNGIGENNLGKILMKIRSILSDNLKY